MKKTLNVRVVFQGTRILIQKEWTKTPCKIEIKVNTYYKALFYQSESWKVNKAFLDTFLIEQFSLRKSRRIVWVCLTILWDWCLKG